MRQSAVHGQMAHELFQRALSTNDFEYAGWARVLRWSSLS